MAMSNSEGRVMFQFMLDNDVIEKAAINFDDLLKEAETFKKLIERKQHLVELIANAEDELEQLIPAIEKKKERMLGLLCNR